MDMFDSARVKLDEAEKLLKSPFIDPARIGEYRGAVLEALRQPNAEEVKSVQGIVDEFIAILMTPSAEKQLNTHDMMLVVACFINALALLARNSDQVVILRNMLPQFDSSLAAMHYGRAIIEMLDQIIDKNEEGK